MIPGGGKVDFCFDPGPLALADIQRRAADIWSDLAFDETALQSLKRDGLPLDGVRLTGPSPFLLESKEDGQVVVSIAPTVTDPSRAETLLDLWRVHFMRSLRPGSLAA